MRPSLIPMSALTMPQWSMTSALVMTVSATSRRDALALAHAVADRLAAAELHLLAVAAGAQRVVVLDLDDQLGVGQADPVADGRAEHLGIGAARRSWPSIERLPCTQAAKAVGLCASPRESTSSTRALLARLEAHRGAGGDVEPHAVRGRRGRSAAPRWSRRSGSASRPGSAGRRCSATTSVDGGAAGVERRCSPSSTSSSPGIMRPWRALMRSAGAR